MLPELVYCPSMTKFNFSCSERPTRVDLVKRIPSFYDIDGEAGMGEIGIKKSTCVII